MAFTPWRQRVLPLAPARGSAPRGSDGIYATKQLEEVRTEARGVLHDDLVEVRQEVSPAGVPPQRG
jgi:hypothetical protein